MADGPCPATGGDHDLKTHPDEPDLVVCTRCGAVL